jgi:hypothetical protein
MTLDDMDWARISVLLIGYGFGGQLGLAWGAVVVLLFMWIDHKING